MFIGSIFIYSFIQKSLCSVPFASTQMYSTQHTFQMIFANKNIYIVTKNKMDDWGQWNWMRHKSSNFREIIMRRIVQESIHHIQRRNNMILDFIQYIHQYPQIRHLVNFTFNVIYYKILIHFAKSNRISGWCVRWMKDSIRLVLGALNESKVRINRGTRTKFRSTRSPSISVQKYIWNMIHSISHH